MTTPKASKATTVATTLGLAAGIFFSFRKGEPTTKILITGGVFGLCGYLLGTAITKFYE